ncbi:sugar kinase [Streptomyces sp. NA04227]|uniref:sugar kinase n=1 Tax=Streptomyces sp. NA04227 TaxID=2742136 RepID=UPI0015924FDD|nr:sugar kinase [Streptomyces sp. NA04227]QKW10102.1 sugar kinase [Streptomyces sp. NA04227]
MPTVDRPVVPRQPEPPGEENTESRGRRIRRRALTLLIIVLLIGIPAGYLIISANQSRDSGRDKEDKYAWRGLRQDWPSKVQRRIYQVPIPPYSADVAYYETNNWRTSRLYVEFLTSNEGLERFLNQLGTDTSELKKNKFPIGARDRHVVRWNFTGLGPWQGLTQVRKKPLPTHDIVVNRSNPAHPRVFLVSTTTP